MEKVYKLTHTIKPDLYFGTLKKAHMYLLANTHYYTNVHAKYSTFKRWIEADGNIEVNMVNDQLFIIDVL